MAPIELVPAEDVISTDIEQDENEIKRRFEYVINYFKSKNPNPTTELKYKNGYELMVAVILSAQTQDKRVNMVTPPLFKKYPNIEDMAKATSDEIYSFISSVNYAGNKSDYLSRTAKIIVSEYKGIIPDNENELQKLPGIGRKTANVILSTLYNKPVVAVDTHVTRVSERIGLVRDAKNPLEIEEQLIKYTPKEEIPKLSHWLILHGRYICIAKAPKCTICGVREVCDFYHINYGNGK